MQQELSRDPTGFQWLIAASTSTAIQSIPWQELNLHRFQ
jgi:hypothetical protein